jgi:hypothetical protein
MKNSFLFIFLFLISVTSWAQSDQPDTSQIDLHQFALTAVKGATSNHDKAKTLLNSLSNSFAWTYTDYEKRTVKQIIARKGGNCFELASVYMALLKELDIQYRPIAEINLHIKSDERERNAEEKIKVMGNKASVFGRIHNDHRWVEIYDEESKDWIPVDPTMNLFGFDQWLKARAWFGARHTLNDEFSSEMIVPVAIFVVDKNDKTKMLEDRTQTYVANKLDELYKHQLANLPSWSAWVKSISELTPHAKKAFAGEENLHAYNNLLEQLSTTYDRLKKEAGDGNLK